MTRMKNHFLFVLFVAKKSLVYFVYLLNYSGSSINLLRRRLLPLSGSRTKTVSGRIGRHERAFRDFKIDSLVIERLVSRVDEFD